MAHENVGVGRNSPDARKQQNKHIITPAEIKDNGDVLRYVPTPEPYLMRKKARTRFKEGHMPQKEMDCPHFTSRIDQYFDYLNDVDRNGRPTNAFVCRECGTTLWLVSGDGKAAADG